MTATPAPSVPLADIATAAETIVAGCDVPVDNATVYSNIGALNPTFGEHLMRDIYVARTCRIDAVVVRQLEPGTRLHGGDEFLLSHQGRLAREQIAPYLLDDPRRLHALLSAWRPAVRVREECLLLARYGLYTWGHWLAELLPKLVVAETVFPGRFRYLLPVDLLSDANPNAAAPRLRETLSAYGLHPSRILPLQPSMDYEFDRLHAISPVWSDHVMHPAVANLMRARLPPSPAEMPQPPRIALLRTGPGRTIANLDPVAALLRQHGFTFHTIGTMPFLDQVRLFRGASLVFAILGSDLTGLLYAPPGVRVISVAPAVFGDRFFYALILDRGGHYADLRGPVTTLNEDVPHRSSFTIDPAQISEAFAALGV